jgi:hypothetical protein
VLALCLTLRGGAGGGCGPGVGIPTAQAQRLAVLPLRIEGQIDEVTRTRWTASLREGLGRGRRSWSTTAQVAPFLEGNVRPPELLRPVRANSGATHIVRTTVVNKNRDFTC